VAWFRNPPRKPWALCVPRKDGTIYRGVYPDFVVFRKTLSGVIADIVDPHLLDDSEAPARAQGLAQYAANHADSFGRIDLIIYDGPNDETGKRLDLVDESVRAKVAGDTNTATTPRSKVFTDFARSPTLLEPMAGGRGLYPGGAIRTSMIGTYRGVVCARRRRPTGCVEARERLEQRR
jgi:hypothetical protein